jgi:hypothetical protein
MAEVRDAQQIRAEIEQARDQLADTVDQLADRVSPKRVVGQTRSALKAKAMSPTGLAVIGVSGVLLTVVVIRNLRRSRS